MVEQLQFGEVVLNLSPDRMIVDVEYLTRGTGATEISPWLHHRRGYTSQFARQLTALLYCMLSTNLSQRGAQASKAWTILLQTFSDERETSSSHSMATTTSFPL